MKIVSYDELRKMLADAINAVRVHIEDEYYVHFSQINIYVLQSPGQWSRCLSLKGGCDSAEVLKIVEEFQNKYILNE